MENDYEEMLQRRSVSQPTSQLVKRLYLRRGDTIVVSNWSADDMRSEINPTTFPLRYSSIRVFAV